jgi:phenylpropionate dioxygenase-like ring-hydroxylating dioxygenase large terminal subunit
MEGLLETGLFTDEAEESYTLPARWYTDTRMPDIEKRSIFYRNWWYFCPLSEVTESGSFVADRVIDQEVAVVRGRDGTLRGFFNVCSHRAHPLLSGSGKARRIVCPYHQWCYGLDGGFQSARGKECLRDEDRDRARLKSVRVAVLGGLVFVDLSGEAPPLEVVAGGLLADVRARCPDFDDLVRVERFERVVNANWKTVIDNNHECYHCDSNHPALTRQIDFKRTYIWAETAYSFSHMVDLGEEADEAFPVDRTVQRQEALFGYLWPNLIPLFWPGSSNLALFQVIPTGPETCLERWDFFLTTKHASPDEQALIDYIKGTLVPEDVGLCENVQRGLRSLGYDQGKLVVDRCRTDISEHHVHLFQKLVRDALIGS